MWFTIAFSFVKSFFVGGKATQLFSSMSSRWKEILLILIAVLFLYQMFSPYQFLFGLDTVPSLNKQIVSLQEKAKAVQANFDACKAGNDKLSAAITKQNEEIKRWGALADKIDASTVELKSRIDAAQNQSKKDVRTILAEPTPKTCEQAMTYLRNSLEDLKWSKPR